MGVGGAADRGSFRVAVLRRVGNAASAVSATANTARCSVSLAAVVMAAAPADDFTAALEMVEKRTRAAIDALRGLEEIAQSNDPNNSAIPLCLESVVNSFEQIRACEASVGSVQVPRDVVESVDQGRNPDAFLAELAERNAAACRATEWSKCPSWHCPSSAPAPPQGAPGGSGQLGTPRKRLANWIPSHCLGCPSQPPPTSHRFCCL